MTGQLESSTDSGLALSSIRPAGPHILVEPDKRELLTKGGLHLPEAHLLPPGTALVVKVSEQASKEGVLPGDRVAYRWIEGPFRAIQCEGRHLKFLRLDEILGTLAA